MKKLTLSLAMLLSASSTLAHSHSVNLYTWSEYVPDDMIEQFEKETGIKVSISFMTSNEEMYAKLKLNPENHGYDVIVPSNYFISKMVAEKMLEKLDHSKLPVIKELNPSWLDKDYDKGNQYSLPLLLGAPGIAFNTDTYTKSDFNSWGDLWKKEYRGKVQLLDDTREVFNIALLKIGEDPNTRDPKIIKKAYDALVQLKPNILSFNSDNPAATFISGEAEIGQIWNGTVRVAKREDAPIDMVFPKEGSVLWVDTFAIPKGAQHKDNAYKLINFLLGEQATAALSKESGYPASNLKSLKHLPQEVVNDPAIFPPDEVINNSYWQQDVGDAVEIYEKYYQQLKAQ